MIKQKGTSTCILILTLLLLQQCGFLRLLTVEAKTVKPILETTIISDRVIFPDELEEILKRTGDYAEESDIDVSSYIGDYGMTYSIYGEDEDSDMSTNVSYELSASTEMKLLCKSDWFWDPVFKSKIILLEEVLGRPVC